MAAALRTALGRIGFSAQAAHAITGNDPDLGQQGFDSLEEFAILKDEEVEHLCKVIRRPGGTIPNPVAGDDDEDDTIPNPGIQIPLRAQNNLKLMCYYLRHQERTSRVADAASITLASIRELRDLRDWENQHEDVEAPTINEKDWPTTIEPIEEYLRGCLGITKIPLAYVVRQRQAVPEGQDPANAYNSVADELIARSSNLAGRGKQRVDPNIHRRQPASLGTDLRVGSRTRLLDVCPSSPAEP